MSRLKLFKGTFADHKDAIGKVDLVLAKNKDDLSSLSELINEKEVLFVFSDEHERKIKTNIEGLHFQGSFFYASDPDSPLTGEPTFVDNLEGLEKTNNDKVICVSIFSNSSRLSLDPIKPIDGYFEDETFTYNSVVDDILFKFTSPHVTILDPCIGDDPTTGSAVISSMKKLNFIGLGAGWSMREEIRKQIVWCYNLGILALPLEMTTNPAEDVFGKEHWRYGDQFAPTQEYRNIVEALVAPWKYLAEQGTGK